MGYRSTFGAPVLADAPPAARDSPFVARLRAAGCVVVGQDQPARVRLDRQHDQCPVRRHRQPLQPRPRRRRLVGRGGGRPGRRHGAAGHRFRRGRVHPDPVGRVRPLGHEALAGRVPGGGPNPPGWLDLSTNGPMARRIADVVTALDVAVGPDPSDLRSLPRPEASWLAALDDPHVPVRVIWAPTLGYADVDAEVLAICGRAVEVLASLGAEVIEVETVFDTDPVGDFLTVMGVCQLRTMRPFMGHPRWEEIDPVLRAIVDAAQSTTARGAGAGLRPLPPHEPDPHRPVPRGPHPGHADLRRRGAPASARARARRTGSRHPIGPSSPIPST